MLTYKTGISAEEHDSFVKNHPQANLLQSSHWATIKENWANERLGFYDDGQQVAAASVLIKSLPLGFTMIYIPRGPIMDYSNRDLVQFVMASLKTFGKQRRAVFIKMDPALHLNTSPIDQKIADKPETLEQITYLTQAGASWSGRTLQLSETIQPRFQANLYAENYALATMSKKTRQMLRTAKNKGLFIRFGHLDLLDDFADLMAKTEHRKNIHLRNKAYYEKLLNIYGQDAYITMAFLNLQEKQEQLQTSLSKAENELVQYTETTPKGKVSNIQKEIERFRKELDFINNQLATGKTLAPLAATLSINFGTTSENLYAGMDEVFRSYNAPLLTWYETAQQAFDRGMTWQNMGGVENDLAGGLYQFKSKLNPIIEEFVGEFNLPVNRPLYKLAMMAYNLRKKLRSKH